MIKLKWKKAAATAAAVAGPVLAGAVVTRVTTGKVDLKAVLRDVVRAAALTIGAAK